MKISGTNDLKENSSPRSKRESPRRKAVRKGKTILIAIVAAVCVARADVITAVGPNPFTFAPFYTDTGRLADGSPYFFHDDQWAAFVFLRLPSCVPPDFNLLDSVDFTLAFPGGPPRVFLCGLTISGHAIWKNGPPPVDDQPAQANLKGLGAVPIWFVKLSEVQAILTGNTLTVSQLLASPSLRKGLADVYDEVDLPGEFRPQGLGNGSIKVVASGSLTDGTPFQLEWLDMGVKNGNGQDFIRHARIAFK